MILSFGDKVTEDIFHGRKSAKARRIGPEILKVVRRKLDAVNAARVLGDLAAVPGNHLEPLPRTMPGFHSIRVNDRWRIVFRWQEGGAAEVRLTDYH